MNYANIPNLDLPWRIFPGRLSVARAFGDIEAKLPELGGNPKVLISTPQIISFKLTDASDFIVMGCKQKFHLRKKKYKKIFNIKYKYQISLKSK